MSDAKRVLEIVVAAKDTASGALKNAGNAVTNLGANANRAATGGLKRLRTGVGNLGKSISGLVSGPLGLIGLGAGLLGVQQFLSGSVDKAQAFADAVMRTQAITGMAVEETSQLVDVLGDYGLEIDKVKNVAGIYAKTTGLLTKNNVNYRKEVKAQEKALGRHLTAHEKLNLQRKLAVKFEKEFGFQLLDSKGKVKDFRTALLDAADMFTNKSIPASQKAAVMMKLFGRNWQELIPLLKKGRKGLEETLGAGLVLTKEQQEQLDKSRVATREWQDALDELQIAIGVELLPVITEFQKRATKFVKEHGPDIVQFFKDAAQFAGRMGHVIVNDVVPVLSRIGDWWASVPDDLKKLLIGGFVINKATGGMLSGIVSDLAKGVIKGVLGINAGVVNIKAATVVGGGAPGGAPGAVGKAAGGMSVARLIVTAAAVTIAGVAVAALVEEIQHFGEVVNTSKADLQTKTEQAVSNTTSGKQAIGNLEGGLKALADQIGTSQSRSLGQFMTGVVLQASGAGKQISSTLLQLSDAIVKQDDLSTKDITKAIDDMKQAQKQAIDLGDRKLADHIGTNIKVLQGRLASATNEQGQRVRMSVQQVGSNTNRNLDQIQSGVGQVRSAVRAIPPPRVNLDLTVQAKTYLSTRTVASALARLHLAKGGSNTNPDIL